MAKRILIVDDEAELVKAVQVRLEANGYEVETAYDGQEAMDKINNMKPDLILLDIVMPVMNGYEVSKKLKSNPDTKEIPIIIFSASQRRNLEKECRELGVTDFIAKPFRTQDLLNTVNNFFKTEE